MPTSKAKQFCETSFKNGKLSAELTASYQCVLRFFPVHLSKVLRLPRKSDARSYEVLRLSRKIISAKPEDLMLQNATPQEISAPDLLTALTNMSLVLRLPWKMHLCRSSSDVPRLPTRPSRFAHFWHGAQSLAPATRNDTSKSKSGANHWSFIKHFDFEMCFAPQTGVHFFDVSTSKNGPNVRCF